MGDQHAAEEHAIDLSHVREVHDVVDNLRRLLAAAAEADAAGAAPPGDPRLPPSSLRQSPPGR